MASLPEIAQLKTQLLKSDLPSKQILEILSKLSAINNIDAKILSVSFSYTPHSNKNHMLIRKRKLAMQLVDFASIRMIPSQIPQKL